MPFDIIPLATFVMVTTFTPGPNNISSASMGVMVGYRKTLNYLAGITAGFFAVMMACAYLSSTLLTAMPAAERYLRWLGAAYILWLAVGMLRYRPEASSSQDTPKAFAKGFMLQLCNPKVAVYGLTLYSTFLAPISNSVGGLLISAAAFALTAFAATSTWAMFGAAIKLKLHNDLFRKWINSTLSILLVYTAVEMTGILS